MITEGKYKWWIWIAVFFAFMNIATILTVIYHRHQSDEETPVSELEDLQTGNRSGRFSRRYFRDQLELNNDQMALFNGFNNRFRIDVRNINIELVKIRQQMLEEMSAVNSDTVLLNRLSDSVGYLHSDLKKITYAYYLNLKNICDRQQQEKLVQLFSGLFTIDIQTGPQGQGGPHGRGRGRRINNYY